MGAGIIMANIFYLF